MKFFYNQYLKNIMKLLKGFQYISLITVILFLLSCDKKPSEAAVDEHEEHTEETGVVEFTEEQFQTVNVKFGTLEERKLSGNIKVNGLLDVPPQQQVSISMPFGGILRSTELLQGMWVKKGQVIARMEHPDYIQLQQEYIDAKSQLGYLEQEYQRQKELSRENVTATKTFQKTEADYKSLNAKVQGLKKKLALLNVHAENLENGNIMQTVPVIAPINGFVTEVNANIGKFVSANDAIFEIVDTEHLHAELIIFEKDVSRLKIGDKVRFVLSNESKERTATIYLIGREISDERTIRVHSHLDEEDKNLLPGMYLKAWIEAGGTEVTALPTEAIVQSEGKNYIFTLVEKADTHSEHVESKENGYEGEEHKEGTHDDHHEYKFKQVEVQVGVSENGFTEVSVPEGFNEKDKIVTKGAYDLLSKMNNSEEEGHAH